MSNMPLLSCHDLDVSIAEIPVAHDLQLELKPGEFWGLMGANGVGKTTLLKCLAGLNPPDKGTVLLDSTPLGEMSRRDTAKRLGMLQQHTVYLFDSSAIQIALTGRHPHLSRWANESQEDIQSAKSALRTVGLEDFDGREVTTLSGGEARRLAFATLMVQDPGILLLDEPTNHLDLRHQLRIMDVASRMIRDEERVALCALHDVNLAAGYCSHILMLFGDAQWRAGPAAEMLNPELLERLYGCPVQAINTEHGLRFHPLGGASGASS